MATQIIAIVIFIVMFVMIVVSKIERQWITLGAALLTIVVVLLLGLKSPGAAMEVLNLKAFISGSFWISRDEISESEIGINWSTVIFILGMMRMVEGMGRSGFFKWLCLRIGKLVNYKPLPLFVAFMVMSALLSMFIDSITVILFLAAVTFELGRMLKINPVPMLLAEIFCSNLGGSATMSGDPPNIIIGTGLHLTFGDFISNTGVIALVSLVFVIAYFFLVYSKELVAEGHVPVDTAALPKPADAISSKPGFAVSLLVFLLTVILLITHAKTHLAVPTIGVIAAVLTLAGNLKHAGELIKKVDYKTLLFFIGLFVVIGGLEEVGVLNVIAHFIEHISKGRNVLMAIIIIWISGIASAFLDNIPFAATMLPVIKVLSVTSGVPVTTLAWALSMGTDIGGSATPIGASANVVGISIAGKNGTLIGWKDYCRTGVPTTILVLVISSIMIVLRYF